MTILLRKLITAVALPIRWRRDRQHAAETLKAFSEIEFDSAWQYLNAIRYVDQPEIQLMLFGNCLEEMEHSDKFLNAAHKLASARMGGHSLARKELVRKPNDVPYFLAFAHDSERSIATQFKGYARACGKFSDAAAVFNDIAIDEEKHEREARSSLVSAVGSERTARWLIFKVKLSKAYSGWMRVSKKLGDMIFAAWLGVIFLLFGSLLRNYCRRTLLNPSRQTPQLGGTKNECY
ncbi:hypothetical protein [Chromobacterium sp. CV08]|uniref:hypothetical protein n=1 Tax=Chromobacterium sp. CV08 TaxID=3133274 RepID=UPI003DA81D99